jgi:hypothetical protein
MNPLAIHPGTAHQFLQATLIGWAAIEIVLRLRNLAGGPVLTGHSHWSSPPSQPASTSGSAPRTCTRRSSAAAGHPLLSD